MTLLGGRSAVVTGAGSGIGRAIARCFAGEGAHVICFDRRGRWSEETVALIEAEGGSAVRVDGDVTSRDDLRAAIGVAVERTGRLDIMCANAGIGSPRQGMALEDHTEGDIERLLAVNAVGVVNACTEAVVRLKAQGAGGTIVNTGSVAGMVAWGGAPYGATKAFVIQLTRALAIETAPYGIRVNCFCPGGIRTNLGLSEEAAFQEPDDAERAALARMHPLGRLLTPEDCAQAALFLASDQSRNITGVALPVDGGYIAR